MAMQSLENDNPIVEVNVTPLVDVCLVLVIIFMVTAPLLSEPVFKVNLPVAQTQEGEEKDKIMVSISREGRVAIDQEEFNDVKSMTPRLRQRLAQSSSKHIVFKADRDATHGRLTELMFLAKELGAQSLIIATEKPNEGR